MKSWIVYESSVCKISPPPFTCSSCVFNPYFKLSLCLAVWHEWVQLPQHVLKKQTINACTKAAGNLLYRPTNIITMHHNHVSHYTLTSAYTETIQRAAVMYGSYTVTSAYMGAWRASYGAHMGDLTCQFAQESPSLKPSVPAKFSGKHKCPGFTILTINITIEEKGRDRNKSEGVPLF